MIALDGQLALFKSRGPSPGAGRPKGIRVSHSSRPELAGRYPAHVTLKVRAGLASLRSGRVVRALEATLREACEQGHFRVVEYSIQGNHLHLLVERPTGRPSAGA